VTVAAPLDRLLRAVARCRAVGDEDLTWLGDQIEGALADQVSLDEALGLQYAARLGARDNKLREAHRRYLPEKTAYAAAGEISSSTAFATRTFFATPGTGAFSANTCASTRQCRRGGSQTVQSGRSMRNVILKPA
jgi:hypothetical protein